MVLHQHRQAHQYQRQGPTNGASMLLPVVMVVAAASTRVGHMGLEKWS
jgi:hypothetical protein